MNVNILKIICLINAFVLTSAYFSKHHKKCQVFKRNNQMSSFPIQRVPLYSHQQIQKQFTKTTEKIIYQDIQFIYDEFIDAGGSGQVFRVEEEKSGNIRILKRFFKENQLQFQQQNFIMKQMEYQIKWHKQDNNPNKSTIASYPSKQSSVLRDLQVQNDQQYAVLFYKICKQIDKAHKKKIIHNDIKMGNILINSIGQGLRTIQVQLIDWNLASFYSQGFEAVDKKGTNCYYSPEALIRTNFITPAIDIWSLAIVYFTFITNKKPFTVNCKDDNFQAILSLVSSSRFLQVYEKYNKASSSQISTIEQIKKNKFLYEGISIRDRLPEQYEKLFDNQMIDLFQKMLQVDPEYRLTISEVLNHPFFDRVKRLPKMYEEKKKKKQKQKQKLKQKQEKQVPANNLVEPQTPSLIKEQQNQSL